MRCHPGCSTQDGTRLFIRADIGTYGKVVGGGMPDRRDRGKREWMDAPRWRPLGIRRRQRSRPQA